jgi:hypothetical protein
MNNIENWLFDFTYYNRHSSGKIVEFFDLIDPMLNQKIDLTKPTKDGKSFMECLFYEQNFDVLDKLINYVDNNTYKNIIFPDKKWLNTLNKNIARHGVKTIPILLKFNHDRSNYNYPDFEKWLEIAEKEVVLNWSLTLTGTDHYSNDSIAKKGAAIIHYLLTSEAPLDVLKKWDTGVNAWIGNKNLVPVLYIKNREQWEYFLSIGGDPELKVDYKEKDIELWEYLHKKIKDKNNNFIVNWAKENNKEKILKKISDKEIRDYFSTLQNYHNINDYLSCLRQREDWNSVVDKNGIPPTWILLNKARVFKSLPQKAKPSFVVKCNRGHSILSWLAFSNTESNYLNQIINDDAFEISKVTNRGCFTDYIIEHDRFFQNYKINKHFVINNASVLKNNKNHKKLFHLTTEEEEDFFQQAIKFFNLDTYDGKSRYSYLNKDSNIYSYFGSLIAQDEIKDLNPAWQAIIFCCLCIKTKLEKNSVYTFNTNVNEKNNNNEILEKIDIKYLYHEHIQKIIETEPELKATYERILLDTTINSNNKTKLKIKI